MYSTESFGIAYVPQQAHIPEHRGHLRAVAVCACMRAVFGAVGARINGVRPGSMGADPIEASGSSALRSGAAARDSS